MENMPVVLMWSGGKDAILTLAELRRQEDYTVVALLTTIVVPDETVTMHGVPLALIEAQAAALGVPLHVMRIPEGAPNAVYEAALERALRPLMARGVQGVACGDLFLEDLRAYRERVIDRIGELQVLFPLWHHDTTKLARRFIDDEYQAIVTSVDTEQLDARFAGRYFDEGFLADLPEHVDPCGERGEFHTLVFDGPLLRYPVSVARGPAHGNGRMRWVEVRCRDQ